MSNHLATNIIDQTLISTDNTPLSDTYDWSKPYGCSYVHIIICGAGGGGGSGCVAAAARAAGGGGGGSSGAQGSFLIPSIFCPEQLFISLGQGGVGGSAVTTGNGIVGTAGSATIITINNNFTPGGNLIVAGGGLGGGAGTSTAGGSGGAAPTATDNTQTRIFMTRSLLGYRNSATSMINGGNAGTAGGFNRVAGTTKNIDTPTGSFILGGTGGGGIGDAGDPVYGGGPMSISLPSIWSVGLGGGTSTSRNGSSGRRFNHMPGFFVVGGTGGATTTGAAGETAGSGGNGILGSGGGGGGSAYIGSTSGAGGKGGDGFVLITTF